MKKQRRSYAAGFLTALLLTGLIGTAGAAVGRRTVEVDYNNIKVSLDGAQVALVDANGSPVGEKTGEKVFTFEIPLSGDVTVRAEAGGQVDETTFHKVDAPNPAYKLQKGKSQSANWV